ncbi:MAG: potassium channel family protein [Acutalibacteraceae bacterium]
MNVIVVGAGHLGYYLARELIENDYKVTLIDIDRKRCEQIANSLDIKVFCGDGSRVETLAAASTGKCDVFIAVTNCDEDNLVACEIAKKQFKVKRTIAKNNRRSNMNIMKKLGVDLVVDEAQIITHMIEHEIDSAQVQLVAEIGSGGAVINEYKIPINWKFSGKKLSELNVPEQCVFVYLKRGDMFMIPRGNSVIMGGDKIIALTVGSSGKQLKKLFAL